MLYKEELVQYLIKGYIHVNRQDYLFFNNLVKFSNEGTTTTGQDKLLNKLIDKYQKQLRKENFDIDALKNLPWIHPLVETQDQYRRAYVKLIEKEIIIKNPFSKRFMQDLNKLGSVNTLEWSKTEKVYRGSCNTFLLKKIIDIVVKNFEEVEFCSNIKNILLEVEQYKNCIWNPTLVQVHGHYYIAACNQQLYDNTSEVVLKNEPSTFFELSKFGINISKDLQSNEVSKFASSYNYEIDIEETDNLVTWLKQLEINDVLIEHRAIYTNSIYRELCHKLEDSDIKVVPYNELKYLNSKEFSIFITFRSQFRHLEINKASKIVYVKNSRPITIR